MANNPYVNKVQKADGTTIIDISDTTATASDCASGKYLYLASGQKVEGSGSSGGGYITQDSDGYVIMPPTSGVPATTTKTITQDGIYDASSDNVTGYSQVTVNVPGVQIYTKTTTVSSDNVSSISFTGLSDEPKAFFVSPDGALTSTSRCVVDVIYNGTDVIGNYNAYSSSQVSVPTSNYGFTYSNGTLSIEVLTSGVSFKGKYKLTCIY